ncbi:MULTISPECIES: hypothetical protein [Bradyrhizobium]|uniref:hypothetical protein n=1 Tax=Bradyrhizobium TaxID=374 RepID=UPI0018AD4E8E|nr:MULTISPECIES: hypothetical protein [Bradyrhizobium]MCS3446130.1 hypothetical protein [Bradyrhizobium elkanii]MCS3562737.1 hypothetical protein [Bradyrhizobium elkanii]MCW2147426.1 hypothetical protein [Bradyrhizobium elkanii]MCW2353491.1 hypothetical protein [Bradyrhizobium elkanii]MCW2371153.1 hypothetical protein [Bradyrhizobium elkanii]
MSLIVDSKQVRKPENLHDALANLCQLFAATVGEDDVKLFKYHVRYDKPKSGEHPWKGTIVEIHVPGHISFNGTTATWTAGEGWEGSLLNKQSRHTTNTENVRGMTGHIS